MKASPKRSEGAAPGQCWFIATCHFTAKEEIGCSQADCPGEAIISESHGHRVWAVPKILRLKTILTSLSSPKGAWKRVKERRDCEHGLK